MTAAHFKRVRRQLGLTQVQLAKRLGVSPNAVARWERGERGISEPVALLVRLLAAMKTTKARGLVHATIIRTGRRRR